jgi:hypothetical protein
MSLEVTTDRQREDRVRRRLERLGYALRKDRARVWNINHQLAYRIVDARNNIVGGANFGLELEDIEEWLAADQGDRRADGRLAS